MIASMPHEPDARSVIGLIDSLDGERRALRKIAKDAT